MKVYKISKGQYGKRLVELVIKGNKVEKVYELVPKVDERRAEFKFLGYDFNLTITRGW